MNTIVFIDGPYLFRLCKHLNFDIDYVKLEKYFANQHGDTFLRSVYYTPYEQNTTLGNVMNFISRNGFEVVGEGVGYDLIVQMAVDSIDYAIKSSLFHAVFFVGDTRFVPLFKYLKSWGVFVEVYSSSSMSEVLLQRSADKFHDLSLIQDQIKRD